MYFLCSHLEKRKSQFYFFENPYYNEHEKCKPKPRKKRGL